MKRITITLIIAVSLGVAAAVAYLYRAPRPQTKPAAGSVTAPTSDASDHRAHAPASNAPAPESMSIAQGEEATRRHMGAGLKAGDMDPVLGRRILYYHDPMVPGNRFDKPGKSPYMEMMLVPVYAEGGAQDRGGIRVSPRMQQNLGVRTAEVSMSELTPRLVAVGSVAFNERNQVTVQARAPGFVERLHVRATLDTVRKNQPLLDLYVPEWVAAQEEFMAVSRMRGEGLAELARAARQRMRQAGMSESQISAVEASGQVQARMTLRAPMAGVLTELATREGATVNPGDTLFRINGLASVWVNVEVPESQAAALRPGLKVQAQTPALPGVVFEGKLQALLPEVNAATRTLKVRMELANPEGRLVPGMFVTLQFTEIKAQAVLTVPSEALIHTGRRVLVMLAEEGGQFRPVQVEVGVESEGRTQIKSGLQAGQRVVVSSQFLIDSESSLKSAQDRFGDSSGNPELPETGTLPQDARGDPKEQTKP